MIADWLGIDDGSDRLAWVYGQIVNRKAAPCVDVYVEWGHE